MGYQDRESMKSLSQAIKDLTQINRLLIRKMVRLENTLYKSNQTLEKRITNQALLEKRVFEEINQISKDIMRFLNDTDYKLIGFGNLKEIFYQLKRFLEKSFVYLCIIVLIILLFKVFKKVREIQAKSKKPYLEKISE